MWTWAAEAGGGAEVWLLGNPGFSFHLQGEQGPCTSSHAGQVGIVPELRLQATSAAAWRYSPTGKMTCRPKLRFWLGMNKHSSSEHWRTETRNVEWDRPAGA